jgi:phosphatidylserine/phosphatidylglycerophosphate/cardiolipin synthase-like enzyme
MSFSDLKQALESTYGDRRVSRSERKTLAELLSAGRVRVDDIHRLRSHAFDLVRREGSNRPPMENLDWLEKTMRVLHQALHQNAVSPSEAYFSPGHECLTQVLTYCDRSRQSIDVCMYTITDNRIKKALLRAHGRGVPVRIVTEDEKLDAPGSDIRELCEAGIRVAIDADSAFMHHKFALFDRAILLNGSFNWTRGATDLNWENLVVSHDPRLVAQFVERFQEYWDTLPRL